MSMIVELKAAIDHLDASDRMIIMSIVGRYQRRASSYSVAMGAAKSAFKTSSVVYLYKTEFNKIRARISERLFDKNTEIFLGRANNIEEVKAILCKQSKA